MSEKWCFIHCKIPRTNDGVNATARSRELLLNTFGDKLRHYYKNDIGYMYANLTRENCTYTEYGVMQGEFFYISKVQSNYQSLVTVIDK